LRTQLEDVERQRASIDNTGELAALVSTDDVINTWVGLPLRAKRTVVDLLLTATILPAGKGARFSPDQVKVAWKP
jgi:hypothetical protein